MTIADFQISGTVPSLTDALNTASGSATRVAKSRSIQFGRKSGPVALYTFWEMLVRDFFYRSDALPVPQPTVSKHLQAKAQEKKTIKSKLVHNNY